MNVNQDNKTDDIKNNIIKNAFLIAVIKKLDLGSIVTFVNKAVCEAADNNLVEENYTGLLFAELLAKEMNIPLSDLINFNREYQDTLIRELISIISVDGSVLEIFKADTLDDESYITFVISDLNIFDKTATFKEIEPEEEEIIEKNDYLIELVRKNKRYSMNILTNNIPQSLFFKGQIEVWDETEGIVADFTDEQLDENETFSYKEGITEDELVACVFKDTRTINLLDKFEGFEDREAKIYQRLVVKNGMINGIDRNAYFHLVIERRTSNEITGNITFTEFKKGEIAGLRKFLSEEISQDVINMYIDMNQYYKFSKGYLLRAQNSKNRSGYGWKWNWNKGIGTYIRGTEYGETTEYVFVGAYISKKFIYDSNIRKPMFQNKEEMDRENEGFFSDLHEKNDEKKVEINNDSEFSETIIDVPSNENPIIDNDNTIITTNTKVDKPNEDEESIYDIEELLAEGNKEKIKFGSKVKYKNLHTGKEIVEVIEDKKIVHKKLIDKCQGDIVKDGIKSYLIISVENK